MKIELRNVKHAEFASQETNCFRATVYVDGEKAGEANNEGCGGPTSVRPRELEERLNAHGKTLPKKSFGEDLGGGEYEQDAETIINDLLCAWLLGRDLKRLLARKIVFTKLGEAGKIFEITGNKEQTARRLADPNVAAKIAGVDRILNLMPFAEALEIYKAL